MFESVKEMSDAVKPAATVLSDRVSVTNAGAVTGELVDKLAWTAAFGADAELRGTARWIIRVAGGGGRHPARVDSRPVHGDGPRRGRRLHRAGHQRARDGLRHGARGHPVGEEAERRRVHLRDRPVRNRLHRAAAARVRGHRAGGGAARGLQRARSSSRAITSRPTPRSTTAPSATRSSRRCAR